MGLVLKGHSTVNGDGLSSAIWPIHTNISFATTVDLSRELSFSDPQIVANLAHEFATSFRTWGSGDFLAALYSRLEIERREIVDELFQRLEALVKTEPTLHKNDLPVAYIMLQKMK